MPETIREFVLGLTFGKPDEKNLDKATASAKKSAKETEAAYKAAAKEVEKAQELVRITSDKTAKKIAQDALHAARQQAKAAKEAANVAVAELKKIERASKEATKASDKALKDHNAMLGKVRGGAGAVVAALGIGGIGAVTTDILEQATAVREWTARLGDAPDVLQRVGGAAKILGVDFEIAMKSIQKLRLGIGEGTANEPLKALGLDAKTLAAMDAQGQLRAIADGLQTVATDAERTAIATRLFGEEGGKLVPVLAGGAAGFDELTRSAEDAGAVMSGETLKAAQDFDRMINTATLTAKGFAAEIAGNVLPRLGELAKDVGVVGEAMGAFGDETEETVDEISAADVATTALAGAFFLVTGFVLGAAAAFDEAADAANRYGLVSSKLTGRVSSGTGGIAAAARKLLAAQAKEQAEIDASVTTGPSFAALKDANRREAEAKKAKRGGGKRKKTEIEYTAEDFEADELFGDEIRRLGEQAGVGQTAIDEAIKAGGSSLKSGDVADVARKSALSRLSQSSGQDYSNKASKDPLLSAIFGENVPDVELSKMALGATPQTLIATINNNFAMQFDIAVDGAGNPADVAAEVHTQSQAMWKDKVAATTKLVKPAFHR